MTRRIKRSANFSLATATFIQLLQDYTNNDVHASSLSRDFTNYLQRVDPGKRASHKLVSNFERIPGKFKQSVFHNSDKLNLTQGSNQEIQSRLGIPLTLALKHDDVSLDPPPTYPSDTEFRVEYTGLYCKEAQGDFWFFGGSDEPYVIVSAVHIDGNGDNIVRTTNHPIGDSNQHYDNIDDGDFRLGPITACWQGRLNGVSLITVAMENDRDNIDDIKEGVDLIVKGASFILSYLGYPIPENIQNWTADLINWLLPTGDDLLGEATYHINEDGMRRFAAYSEDPILRDTNLPFHFSTEHKEDGSYVVTYKVTANKQPNRRLTNLFKPKFIGVLSNAK